MKCNNYIKLLLGLIVLGSSNMVNAVTLSYPDDCDYSWEVKDVSEVYAVAGPTVAGGAVFSCFQTINGLPGGISGGAADDLHIVINTPNGGTMRSGLSTGTVTTINGGGPDIGHLQGDTYSLQPGINTIDFVNLNGIPLDLGVLNRIGGANILCLFFTDAGDGPDANPCPPLVIPIEDMIIRHPPIIFDFPPLILSSSAVNNFPAGGITFFVPEPPAFLLVLFGLTILRFYIKISAASDRVLRTQRLYRFAMKKLEALYVYVHHRDIPRAG